MLNLAFNQRVVLLKNEAEKEAQEIHNIEANQKTYIDTTALYQQQDSMVLLHVVSEPRPSQKE